MAKRDITRRPRRALSAEERQELFREFKLGICALVALVGLVVTLCWDRGGSAEPAGEPGKSVDKNGDALVRVVWHPGDQGGSPPVQTHRPPRVDEPLEPKQQAPQRPAKRAGPPVRQHRVPPKPRKVVPPPPTYRNYVVRRRDTFWKIARTQLGDGSRWKALAKANPGVNPKRIKKGMIIRIPVIASHLPAGQIAGAPDNSGVGLLNSQMPVE